VSEVAYKSHRFFWIFSTYKIRRVTILDRTDEQISPMSIQRRNLSTSTGPIATGGVDLSGLVADGRGDFPVAEVEECYAEREKAVSSITFTHFPANRL